MSTPQRPASISSRLGAYALDLLIGVVLAVAAGLLARSESVLTMLIGVVLALGYWLWLLSWISSAGLTPGKKVVGVRIVDADTGLAIGFGRAFVRQLVLGVLGPVNLVQLFTITGSPRLQGWHDRAARSVVISTSAGTAAAVRAEAAAVKPEAPRLTGPPLPTAPRPRGMVPPPPGVAPAPWPVAEPVPPVAPVQPVRPPEPVAPVQPTEPVAPEPVEAPTRIRPITRVVPVLRTPAGLQIELTGLVLVGRDPDASLVPGSVAWRLGDPDLTVSKTHALLGNDAGILWIEDWHSTNGVVIRRRGTEIELEPHRRTPLERDDEIDLGELTLTLKDNA